MGETEILCLGAGAAPLAPQANLGMTTTVRTKAQMKGWEEEMLDYFGGEVPHGPVVQLVLVGLEVVVL